LKKAANVVVEACGGVFPSKYEQILSLPGIGEYTAGAICSIAFNQPTPAVDGNVLRVISRITSDDTPIDLPAYKKQVREALTAIYPEDAADFTQALMELGATVCGPNRAPDCANCPCSTFCQGAAKGTAEKLPVKLPKRSRRVEERTVFILSCEGFYALEKRPDKGLLASLWQFPNVDGKLDLDAAIAAVEGMGTKPREILRQVERTHIFTHIEWDMRGVYMEVAEKTNSFRWFSEEQIRTEAALPTAFRQFWDELQTGQ
jgi:A/G-specific adenine glycosylase